MEQFDVVIVGARCAGSATARLLALGGARVLTVDRATFPSDTHSTHSVAWHGSRLLQRWGLFDRLVELGTPNPRETTVRFGEITMERVPADAHTPGAFAPLRTVIDAVLVEAAQDAGVQLWESTSLEKLIWDGDTVTGCVVRRRGRSTPVRAGVVIGADGADSAVARLVGAPSYRIRPSDLAGAYAYFADGPVDHPHLLLADNRAVLAFVTNDGLVCLAACAKSTAAGDLLEASDHSFRDAVSTIAPAMAEAIAGTRRVSRFHAVRPKPSVMRVPCGAGWALAGDAGHYLDPATGQGMANAFLSAQLLSDALLAGEALDVYHRRRDELLGEMHDITASVSTMDWSNDEVLGEFARFRSVGAATLQAVDDLTAPDGGVFANRPPARSCAS